MNLLHSSIGPPTPTSTASSGGMPRYAPPRRIIGAALGPERPTNAIGPAIPPGARGPDGEGVADSSESDGDSSLVSRSSTAPTGLDLAGHADGTPCTQLPDPEPEGALRDVSGDDGDERRAAPSKPEQDSPVELQQQVKQLKAELSKQEAAARSAMQKSLRVQEQAQDRAEKEAAKLY